MYTRLCRRCLKTYGSQSLVKNYIKRCMELEIYSKSYVNLDNKIKSYFWFVKKDSKLWIAADFECINIATDDPQQKAEFVSKPTGVDYKTVKNPCYENLKLGENGYNKKLGRELADWFVNEMLKKRLIEAFLEQKIETISDTMRDCVYDENRISFCEKEFKKEDEQKVQLFKIIVN